jgi:hypothetical protein
MLHLFWGTYLVLGFVFLLLVKTFVDIVRYISNPHKVDGKFVNDLFVGLGTVTVIGLGAYSINKLNQVQNELRDLKEQIKYQR